MSATVQFIQYDAEKLEAKLMAVVDSKLDGFLTHFKPVQHAEYLTRQQVAQMFDVDLSTVHNWCKSKKLNPLGIGSRVYFLRSEIEASLIPLNK